MGDSRESEAGDGDSALPLELLDAEVAKIIAERRSFAASGPVREDGGLRSDKRNRSTGTGVVRPAEESRREHP